VKTWRHYRVWRRDMLTWLARSLRNLAGDDVIVFIDSCPLISLKNMLASNQISRNLTHGNPMDFAKGSTNVSKRELLAVEDFVTVADMSVCYCYCYYSLLLLWLLVFPQLTVDPSGPAFDLHVPVPTIIGSIPLAATLQQYGAPAPYPPPAPGPSAPGMPPMNYDDSTMPTAPPAAYPPNMRKFVVGLCICQEMASYIRCCAIVLSVTIPLTNHRQASHATLLGSD
jgi:hypothetical protein